jgi:hypothetical protein
VVLVGNLHVVHGKSVRLKQVAGAARPGDGRVAVSEVDRDGSLPLGFRDYPVVCGRDDVGEDSRGRELVGAKRGCVERDVSAR